MKTGMGRGAGVFQADRLRDPGKRIRSGLILLAAVVFSGTIGYAALGLSLGDAVYQTVITVSTVGYQEVGSVTGWYRVFTVVLILSGTGTVLYTLSVLIEAIFEGRVNNQLRRRHMQTSIDRLKGHIVICGFGQIGRTIYTELYRKNLQIVVIDRHDHYDDDEYHDYGVKYWVSGDATEDNSLLRASVQHACTLVLALRSDVDNLYVALTARSMNASLCIVSSVHELSVVPKLRQAGADHVVNPYEIGGSRMAELVLDSDKSEAEDAAAEAGGADFAGRRRGWGSKARSLPRRLRARRSWRG